MNFMGVEWEYDCDYDFFQIAWPNDSGEKTVTQKFCGNKNGYNPDSNSTNEFPEEGLTINSSEFELRWSTDGSVIGEGFELEWSCTHGQRIPKIDPCNLSFAFKFSVCFFYFLVDDTGYFRSHIYKLYQ